MHKIFSNVHQNRRWQTTGQGPAKNKQPRILTRRPARRSYEKTVGAFLEQTVNSCQKTYAHKSERTEAAVQDDGGSDEEPPPPQENIFLEERMLTDEQKEFFAEIERTSQEQTEEYSTAQSATYYTHGTPEQDTNYQAFDQVQRDQIMLMLQYKGIQTNYLPDEEKLGLLKKPSNLGDVLERKVEKVLDL
ncbi:hypothetical protein KY363_00510 [Candidatus Woesearchaeota archaeon]|nr:hypothetical protein [Candidatus Woesearchaeota archaeon]